MLLVNKISAYATPNERNETRRTSNTLENTVSESCSSLEATAYSVGDLVEYGCGTTGNIVNNTTNDIANCGERVRLATSS